MKNSFIIILLLTVSYAFAQNQEGQITYEDKRNIHKTLPPEMEALKDRIPEFRTSEKILYFNSEEAVYKGVVKEKKKDEEFRGERRRRGRWNRDNNASVYYTNFNDNQSVDSRDFFGKKFLIEGVRDSKKWKMTGDQKQVGDYICQKATFKDSLNSIVVWFTPMIPVSTGPDDFFGLPGVILHVDINDGERLITAQNVELKTFEESVISRPSEGKQISQQEFETMREDKMKEMEQMRAGRGGGRGYFFGRGK
ncbi:MAG: GLPGLI family protein [Saprospiraceae bacterium]|nr:GLPGLI family protein [Saprospiraceae bacterium]